MPWVEEPSLEDGERIVDSFWANRAQGWWRSSGGKLWITSTHLRFRPNAPDVILGGRSIDHELREIVRVDVAPRSLNLLAGGMRRRLRVALQDHSSEYFVVSNVASRVNRIRFLLQSETP